MTRTLRILDLLGRLLVTLLFFVSGYSHFAKWAGTIALMAGRGVPLPRVLLAGAAAVEIGGAICLVLGWQTRAAAFALAAFSIAATSLFHFHLGVEVEMHAFGKDLAIAGALFCLGVRSPRPLILAGVANGQTPVSGAH